MFKHKLSSYIEIMMTKHEWMIIIYPSVFYLLARAAVSTELHQQYNEFLPMIIFTLITYNLIIMYQLWEKTGEYIIKRNKKSFLFFIIVVCASLILSYAVQFDILCDICNNSFDNAAIDNPIHRLWDFIFYSLGVFLANNISNVMPVSIWAQILSSLLIINQFFLIVIFLSNIKTIGKIFNTLD